MASLALAKQMIYRQSASAMDLLTAKMKISKVLSSARDTENTSRGAPPSAMAGAAHHATAIQAKADPMS